MNDDVTGSVGPSYDKAVAVLADMMRGGYDERRVYGAVLAVSRIWGVEAKELLRDSLAALKGVTT